MTADERTGWRDMNLSKCHRLWGFNVPASDVDLFVEYDRKVAKALVEYKHERAQTAHSKDPSVACLIDLADRASIPMLGVRYTDDLAQYTVTSLNSHATRYIANSDTVSEEDYVRLLYTIRGREMPDDIVKKIRGSA